MKKRRMLAIFTSFLAICILTGCGRRPATAVPTATPIPAAPAAAGVTAAATASTADNPAGIQVTTNPPAREPLQIEPGATYEPDLNPANFTINITNPYFSLPVGRRLVYESEVPEGLERIEIFVPGWTRNVAGVETLVFWDRVYVDGELIEDTRDYLAQHKETGDVWYFGEHVDNYEDGVLVDHEGAWMTGEDNAKPGIWVLADPQIGDMFRNEYRKGEAEDESEVLSTLESVSVPFGDFDNCVQHLDGSPLFAAQAHAYYCKGSAAEVFAVDLAGPENPEDQFVELIEVDPFGALGATLPEAYAAEGVVAAPFAAATNAAGRVECVAGGETAAIAAARLYVEYNATDGDLGVHGGFDDHGWSQLCIFAPDGNQLLGIMPQSNLGNLSMASIFFESREPELSEFSFDDLMAGFPEGEYEVRGLSFDGTVLAGAATFSHNIPVEPVITFPVLAEDEETAVDAIVAAADLVVIWEDVTETVNGDPAQISGYEVIITKVDHEDPHGFSQPVYDVHLPPGRNSLAVPADFLEPETVYELEVLALEESGNQTITVGFFQTDS